MVEETELRTVLLLEETELRTVLLMEETELRTNFSDGGNRIEDKFY